MTSLREESKRRSSAAEPKTSSRRTPCRRHVA
jgi:hypothetical protein